MDTQRAPPIRDRLSGGEGGTSYVVGFAADVGPAPFEEFVEVYDNPYHSMTLGFIALNDGLGPGEPIPIVGLQVWVN
jgi:hypothetical protein